MTEFNLILLVFKSIVCQKKKKKKHNIKIDKLIKHNI